MKDKEDYGSFEGYEDGDGVYVPYAVGNQQGAAKAPPHTSSASNIADLDIVMGSQVCVCVCVCVFSSSASTALTSSPMKNERSIDRPSVVAD